jgi:hypothetical protein
MLEYFDAVCVQSVTPHLSLTFRIMFVVSHLLPHTLPVSHFLLLYWVSQ